MIIDPDQFLETPDGRLWTPERSLEAWVAAFAALDAALAAAEQNVRLVVVCGVQGSGKSTWAKTAELKRPADIFFAAALPGARHRQPLVAAGRRHGARVCAVWIDVALAVALHRNAQRSTDQVVPDTAIRAVFENFEPPSRAEGFQTIRVIRA